MSWQVIAEGNSFDELRAVVEDMELPKGTPVEARLKLKFPFGFYFDGAWAEREIKEKGYVPEGMILKDVYGEGAWEAVISLEADPPVFILALVNFLAKNWGKIIIVGLLFAALVSAIKLVAWIAEKIPRLPDFFKDVAELLVFGGFGLLALWAFRRR